MKGSISMTGTLIMVLVVLSVSLVSVPVWAKNLGTVGDTYPILEEDLIHFLKQRFETMQKNGEWEGISRSAKERAKRYRDRPLPVNGLARTHKNKTFLVNPGITLDHDVLTADGRLVAKSGTRINPLVYVPLTKALVFFDADDLDQVKWAKSRSQKSASHDKLILVKGSLLAEEKRFQQTVYFDQEGRLVKRFGIKHVPAVVEQDGLMLKITEVRP